MVDPAQFCYFALLLKRFTHGLTRGRGARRCDQTGSGCALLTTSETTLAQGGDPMRHWKPHISAHAMGRYLERVLGVAVPRPQQEVAQQVPRMLALAELSSEELREVMWPDRCNLEGDPCCRFVLKRGGFVLLVSNGVVVTVLDANHYRSHRPRSLIGNAHAQGEPCGAR